jgi:hypothetical protein
MNFIGPKGHTPTAAKPRLPLDTPAHTLGPKGRPRGSSCRRAALLRPSFSRPL